ncbi:glycine/D-amino acid oxidase-like deaminating enzyme [Pseudomonas lini]|uniref:NAD(P)/FAD-dependent oxidoreductase n=1 Tax=Pseudomonas lini TaxID=163011 RepID=UPI002782A320|nr:FAD-dependent oxidoreductase [Pseudomonas lini]MDQ0122127.1 glycine/D-amino acid oxidase-like deaminating enzyme [Pseudomonas lini]
MKLLPALSGAEQSSWSWWREDIQPLHGLPLRPLRGAINVDVVIIGGGFTGMWTALALRQRAPHLSVALLEANRLGDGASSKNGGMVHGYWASLPGNIRAMGVDNALDIALLGSKAQNAFREFAFKPGRDIWWNEKGNLRVATCEAQERTLKTFLEQCQGLGVEKYIQPLDRKKVRELIDAPAFGSGIYFPEAGNVHPGKLIIELKKAVIEAGVQVYEHTPVSRVEDGFPHRVQCENGVVIAKDVVLATNVGLAGIPSLTNKFSIFSSYATMSNQTEEGLSNVGWSTPVGVSDARMFLHYFRRTNDNRVLMGSGSGPIGWRSEIDGLALRQDEQSVGRARRGMKHLLPSVAQAGFAKSWGWPIDVSSDRIPFFKTLKRRIHYGGGYSGHGVQATWIGGQCLASLVLNTQDEWTLSPFCNRRMPSLPPEPFKFIGASAIRWGVLSCEEAEQVARNAPFPAKALAALPSILGLRIGVR